MKATLPLHLYVLAVLCLPFAPLFGVMDVDVNIYAVGQGNGVLVKGGNHAMLIDAGSSASRLTALFSDICPSPPQDDQSTAQGTSC